MPALLYFFAPIFLTPSPSLLPPIAMQADDAEVAEGGGEDSVAAPQPGEEAEVPPEPAEEPVIDEQPVTEEVPTAEETAARAEPPPLESVQEDDVMAAQLRERQQIAGVHRAFGIATWISMTTTLILGAIQFHDEYGGATAGETPCGQMNPIGNQDYCFYSVPVPHLTSALITSALYYTTFTLSLTMPDPLGVGEAEGWAGERLRIHKALRWAHFAGMLATTVFGFVTAALPMDANIDFGTRQALAAVHLGLASTTYALLSAAALVISF